LPGKSLLRLAAEPEQERTAFGDYHAVGSSSGAFMLADGRYKYHHYVGYPPELSDLVDDPQEAVWGSRAGTVRYSPIANGACVISSTRRRRTGWQRTNRTHL